MALTSSMMPLGTKAPDFTLHDVISNSSYHLSEKKSKFATVIMFICNHCPYVKHVQQGLVQMANDYQNKGIEFIAINSNDPQTYPEDSAENMKKVAQNLKYPFAYLFDETQNVARAYQAVCTPDFFIFDNELKCVYRGEFDDSRPSNGVPVTGKYLRSALDCLLAGESVDANQKPSMGCGIKWKNE